MPADPLHALANVVAPMLSGGRVIVGIAGAPGAGKSTLAAGLVGCFRQRAVVVPMDGFHLSNEELARLGMAGRKGSPETFDAWGFVHLMRRLRAAEELVYVPAFDRRIEVSIGSAIPVPPALELVVVEGNYLLLPDQPWSLARPLFDLVAYLDVPAEVRVPRLLARARAGGRDEAGAYDWVHRNDEANARLVSASAGRADLVLPA
ncbi:MAG TPA: nucleoside/nucleotide kinase family protein [Micromonosporaceae bacterium]